MGVTENSLATIDQSRVNMILANVDTTGLTDEEKQNLAMILAEDYEASKQGFTFKPQRFKINKDSQNFSDPLGQIHDEIRGVVVFKQITRGYWDRTNKEDKSPVCSSIDGLTGRDRDGNARPCATCPNNQWGSASTAEEQRKGKACKEMRRAFVIPSGQFVPIMVSLPPTSLKDWDNFWSARVTQGIPDLAAEAIMSLIPAKIGGYEVSVIRMKSGNKVSPKDMLELNKVKKQFASSWAQTEITEEDYEHDDTGSTQDAAANNAEPY
jgi:hypothetical protein